MCSSILNVWVTVNDRLPRGSSHHRPCPSSNTLLITPVSFLVRLYSFYIHFIISLIANFSTNIPWVWSFTLLFKSVWFLDHSCRTVLWKEESKLTMTRYVTCQYISNDVIESLYHLGTEQVPFIPSNNSSNSVFKIF